jgi:uncharacterized repeat protein (TIGR03803 family)
MTVLGGSANGGVVFRMGLDGTNPTLLHVFQGGAADGAHPQGQLALYNSTLFGMTQSGGPANDGTIFRMDLDGGNYGLMHVFTGGPGDGANPQGGLVLDGSTLYGTTGVGGSANLGTVLGIGLDGTGYQTLYSFTGGTLDGANPGADLLVVGSALYGTTGGGGSANDGVVFSIAIPEPSTLLLVTAGGAAAAHWIRRARRRGSNARGSGLGRGASQR